MLKLKELQLILADEPRPGLALQFEVTHNVGALRTTLSCDLTVNIAPHSGKVQASLALDDLEADTLDEARIKMAVWCDRMAAALRDVNRISGEVPQYERRTFELATLPGWLQREYHVLAERFKACASSEPGDDVTTLRNELIEQGHPLIYVRGAFDELSSLAYRDD